MRIISILTLLLLISCKTDKRKIVGDSEFQRDLNTLFKDASTSPLIKEDLKTFKGLSFFKEDDNFKVNARFLEAQSLEVFNFPTTKGKTVQYKKHGMISFKLQDKDFELSIFKEDKLNSPELFLPFFDKTNKKSTYEGGRFINVSISDIKNNMIEIDFNKAYNPYCAYNKKYSCPLTPRSNFLDIEVTAGVKIK